MAWTRKMCELVKAKAGFDIKSSCDWINREFFAIF